MRIGFCGPASLAMLEQFVDGPIRHRGYPFTGTADLIAQYIQMGHFVHLVSTDAAITSPVEYMGQQLRVTLVPSRSRARDRALDLFRKEREGIRHAILAAKVDVIHAHWTYEFALAAQSTSLPLVITVHDWAPTVARHNKNLYWYFRWWMQIMCCTGRGIFTAPTRHIAQRVERVFHRPCNVVPNGLNLSAWNDSYKGTISPPKVGMLNVGFSSLKNVSAALEAWPEVRARIPDARLVLAGPGYEMGGAAHAWAIDHNLTDGVVFDGALQASARLPWLTDKQIFLHTSRHESFSLAIVEAMAVGLPVIAGERAGAVPEITQGEARLVDVSDPSQVANSVTDLLNDSGARLKMSSRGKRVIQRFDIGVVASEYIRLLEVSLQ